MLRVPQEKVSFSFSTKLCFYVVIYFIGLNKKFTTPLFVLGYILYLQIVYVIKAVIKTMEVGKLPQYPLLRIVDTAIASNTC